VHVVGCFGLKDKLGVGPGMNGGAVLLEVMGSRAAFAEEGQVPEAEHVEAGEQGGDESNEVEGFAEGAVLEGFVEDGVLGEEAGEGPDAGYSDNASGHGPGR
jgi:hypothetical protein